MNRNRISIWLYSVCFLLFPLLSQQALAQETYEDLLRQGTVFRSEKNYPKAIEYYKKAIQLKPDDAEPYGALGFTYCMMKRYKESIEASKKAINLKPDSAFAYSTLGSSYKGIGLLKKAIECYKQSIKLDPDNPLIHHLLAIAYWDTRKYKEAIESFKVAIQLEPNPKLRCLYVRGLGTLYNNIGQHAEALVCAKEMVKLEPNSPEAHYSLGMAYSIVGQRALALEEYKILKTLDKKEADTLFNHIYK